MGRQRRFVFEAVELEVPFALKLVRDLEFIRIGELAPFLREDLVGLLLVWSPEVSSNDA